MKIHRMFRVCAPGRALPTGTLSVLDDDGDGNAFFMVVMDDGSKQNHLVKGYRIGDLYQATAENTTPCGTITGMVGAIEITTRRGESSIFANSATRSGRRRPYSRSARRG